MHLIGCFDYLFWSILSVEVISSQIVGWEEVTTCDCVCVTGSSLYGYNIDSALLLLHVRKVQQSSHLIIISLSYPRLDSR